MKKIVVQVEFEVPNKWNETELNDFLRRAEHNLLVHYTHGPNLETKYHPDVVRVAEVDFGNEKVRYDQP